MALVVECRAWIIRIAFWGILYYMFYMRIIQIVSVIIPGFYIAGAFPAFH